jgi:hypothetical protein
MINQLCQKFAPAGLLILILLTLPVTVLAATEDKKPAAKATKNISLQR